MIIEKRGLIYCPDGSNESEAHSFMTPHAMKIESDKIRIWGGVRDDSGVSRIRYIDVSEKDPSIVLNVGDKFSLDVGNPGCFDDNGIILGDIIRVKEDLYMYYVGFQHVQNVKFFAFSGLAISNDNGVSFNRVQEVPVLDRTTTGRYGRCIHTVLYEDSVFKCWYAIINDWKYINGTPYPVYNIWYTESKDGIHFSTKDSTLCVDVKDDEYRIGRPKVYKTSEGYEMFYTRDLISKEYLAGYAVSKDGIKWKRKDEEFILPKSAIGWDSEMACYPVSYNSGNHNYIFYNGNGMGRTGVGYAEVYADK